MGKEYAGELTLASRGMFYDGKLPSGSIHVDPWGTLEERLFLSPNINFEDTIDRLIARCTDSPVPPTDLLLTDRAQIFLFMRCLSYGGSYQFRFMCDNCRETVQHPMDLEKDLSVRYADDPDLIKSLGFAEGTSLTEPFEVILPLQAKTLGWRMLRGADERAIDKHVTRQSRGHRAPDERPDYIYRHALRVVTIDGEKPEDINAAIAQIESMKGKDALAWREAIDMVDFGVNMEIEASCRKCGYMNDVAVPLDKSFFVPLVTSVAPRLKDSSRIIFELVKYGNLTYRDAVHLPVFERDFYHELARKAHSDDQEFQLGLHGRKRK